MLDAFQNLWRVWWRRCGGAAQHVRRGLSPVRPFVGTFLFDALTLADLAGLFVGTILLLLGRHTVERIDLVLCSKLMQILSLSLGLNEIIHLQGAKCCRLGFSGLNGSP